MSDPKHAGAGAQLDVADEQSLRHVVAVEIAGLTRATPGTWRLSSRRERLKTLQSVASAVTRTYQIPHYTVRAELMPLAQAGFCYRNRKAIAINKFLLFRKWRAHAVVTVLHEVRHGHQFATWPEHGYVTWNADPSGYWAQPAERDARDFASAVWDEVCNINGAMARVAGEISPLAADGPPPPPIRKGLGRAMTVVESMKRVYARTAAADRQLATQGIGT